MATEAQIAANRRNAAHSTGPRTPEGKAVSRGNALVHGLAGDGTVLPAAMQADLDERLEDWCDDLRPAGQVEGFLARTAAVESVKYDHATRHRFAALALRLRHAEAGWENARRREVEALVARFDAEVDPLPALGALRETAGGCDWLIGRWAELDEHVDRCGSWGVAQLALALALIGIPKDARDVSRLAQPWLELRQKLERVPAMERLLDAENLSPEDEARVDAYAEAHGAALDALRRKVAAEVARLRSLRDRLDAEHDRPDREEAGRRALFIAEEDMPLRRYETASLLGVTRALDQLSRLRKPSGTAAPRPVVAPAAPPTAPPPPATAAAPEPARAEPREAARPARNEPNFDARLGQATTHGRPDATLAVSISPAATPPARPTPLGGPSASPA